MRTKTLAILSEKGGAGKTTTVIHIAVAALLMGQEVAVIDLDPQASAADWCDRRGGAPEAVTIPPARLEKLLGELRGNDVDLVIVDTPREANNAAYTAAQCADLVLIPLQPGGFDYRALTRTLDICRLAHKTPYVILNGMRPGAHRAEADARETVAAMQCAVAPVVFHERAAYRTASITTKTAQETDPDSIAAAEIRALYMWVAQQLDLSTTQQQEKETA
jgi:chromosome partitioning protein